MDKKNWIYITLCLALILVYPIIINVIFPPPPPTAPGTTPPPAPGAVQPATLAAVGPRCSLAVRQQHRSLSADSPSRPPAQQRAAGAESAAGAEGCFGE
ncbi:MAG: hypothetical protein HC904_02975 [Blastochloris sp.]|nr:hypothetical protein [Blastochloris sp.]